MIRLPSANVQLGQRISGEPLSATVRAPSIPRVQMLERADPWMAGLIGRAMNELVAGNGEVTRSAFNVFDYLVWIARRSYEAGREAAMMELLTSAEVAELLDRKSVV